MSHLTQVARKLRKRMTTPEVFLWDRLKRRQLGGLKFRKQAPVYNYIVDFLCYDKKLVIEIDGDTHIHQKQYDQNRSKALRAAGFLVLRYTNTEIMNNIDGVLQDILNTVNPPLPPP